MPDGSDNYDSDDNEQRNTGLKNDTSEQCLGLGMTSTQNTLFSLSQCNSMEDDGNLNKNVELDKNVSADVNVTITKLKEKEKNKQKPLQPNGKTSLV